MKYIIFFIILFGSVKSIGQGWDGFGKFSSHVVCLYSDSIENTLYVGGNFTTIGDSVYNGITFWDSTQFFEMGTGQDFCNPFNCPTIPDIIRFKDKILVSTPFSPFDGIEHGGIVQWDGDTWSSFDKKFYDLNFNIGGLLNFETINEDLYIFGGFSYVDSLPFGKIIKWKDDQVFDLSFPTPFNIEFATITDIALYQDELYVAGNLLLEDGNENFIHDILKYNGNTWLKISEGLVGNNTTIEDLIVYDGELYACGLIYESEGNPGDGMVKFDGEKWTDVGGSFGNGAIVHKMLIYENELYAFGGFDSVGNIQANNLAKWNGKSWCSFPYIFDNKIGDAEIYNGNLLIGGGFNTINGDSISKLAISTDFFAPDFCDTTTLNTISYLKDNDIDFSISPNPSQENLTITIEGGIKEKFSTLTLTNLLGQTLHQVQVSHFEKKWTYELDVSAYPSGTYFLTLQSGEGILTRKVVVQNN